MVLFLITAIFLGFSYEFLLMIGLIFFFILNNFSWLGFFLKFDRNLWFSLFFLCFLLLIFLNWRENNENMKKIINTLIFFSFIFFFSFNFLWLYIFFELTLFPIIVIILVFGSQIEKINSSYYLIFYTIFCRIPWLIIFFFVNIDLIFNYLFILFSWELTLFFSLLFLVKFPIYFFHLWLPKAHVEAPTRARILLAALLLKLGTSALFRILIILNFNNLLVWFIIRFFGITAGVVNCFLQRDSKSLLAYRSIIHINFLFFILLVLNNFVKSSSFLIIISHGFVSSLLFFFIGEFYKIRNTRFIFYFKNLILSRMFFLYLVIFCILGNRAVPISLSFFLELLGIYGGFMFLIISFTVVGFYFFFSFYARFYLLVRGLIGKKIIYFRNLNIVFFYFFVFLRYFFLIFIFLISIFSLNKI